MIERWIRLRWFVAFIGIAVFACAFPIANRLEMDRDITSMFDPDDPALLAYQELQAAFGSNAVVMIVYRDTNLMSPEGIARNEQLTERATSVVGVRDVLSPSRISSLVGKINPQGLLASLSSTQPALLNQGDSVAVGMDRAFAGYTHSSDYRLAAAVVVLKQAHPPTTIAALRQLGNQFVTENQATCSDMSLVGEPILIHDGFALIERDGAKLATWTIVLLSIVVLVSMFDFRFVLLMIGVTYWSVVVTQASLVLLSIELSLVSTILTAIVTVIAVASVLHLGVRFRNAIHRGKFPNEAATKTLTGLIVPIFWTCATDAAGFAALNGSRILPVQQFGLMIAIAAVSVFGALLLFTPAAMMMPMIAGGYRIGDAQRKLARRLQRICRLVARRFVGSPSLTCLAIAIMGAIAAAGLWRGETETSFLKNFRDGSPVVAAYENVEQNFGGAGVWDVILDAPAEVDGDFLTLVRKLQSDLLKIEVNGEGLTKALSIADIDSVASEATLLKLAPVSARLSGMRVALPVFSDALLSPVDLADPSSSRKLRIMIRSREHLGALQKTQLIEQVKSVVAHHTTQATWRTIVGESTSAGRVTGYYVMMADLVSQLVRDQWRCFVASGVMVWLLLLVATRSIRLATAALFPNLLPALVVIAIVGIFGGKINMGAAMIAAVSVGLSIDGSVHFLASYQNHRARGHHAKHSAVHASGDIGVPVLLATIALVIGFSVLATSEFVPTATFGMLVAATMAAGTMVNLTLLPALVSWIDR